MTRVSSVLGTIGNTPHVQLTRLFGTRVDVWMKLERANPGGSIKDRIALAMIEDAEARGVLTKDTVIVEPTSGNTGIGLAMVAAVKGYRLILVMPESMSVERRRIMLAYGAEFELTPREVGMKGAMAKAQELAAALPKAWIPSQFDIPSRRSARAGSLPFWRWSSACLWRSLTFRSSLPRSLKFKPALAPVRQRFRGCKRRI